MPKRCAPQPWRERKESYVHHLSEASDSALLVSLADKLHNAHAILRDFRAHGDELWQRFNVKDPKEHLWYYRSLLEVYAKCLEDGRQGALTRLEETLSGSRRRWEIGLSRACPGREAPTTGGESQAGPDRDTLG